LVGRFGKGDDPVSAHEGVNRGRDDCCGHGGIVNGWLCGDRQRRCDYDCGLLGPGKQNYDQPDDDGADHSDDRHQNVGECGLRHDARQCVIHDALLLSHLM
jgi:hypothetical protein